MMKGAKIFIVGENKGLKEIGEVVSIQFTKETPSEIFPAMKEYTLAFGNPKPQLLLEAHREDIPR